MVKKVDLQEATNLFEGDKNERNIFFA